MKHRKRFRYRLVCWLLHRLTLDEVRTLWHDTGRRLDYLNDGVVGRAKSE